MRCQELAARIEEFTPDAEANDVARLCLLLSNAIDNIDDLADESCLRQASQDMRIRLQAARDQHAGMTRELEELAQSDPEKFHPEQIWVLIRAIKVQSQILHMYLGQPVLDV